MRVRIAQRPGPTGCLRRTPGHRGWRTPHRRTAIRPWDCPLQCLV